MNDTSIVEFNEFELKLTEFKGRYNNVVYDLTIPNQEKQARSDRLAIGKVVSRLDKIHKQIKAPLKEKVDLIDGERKRIKDQLLGIQEKIKVQIKEHEDRIAAEEAAREQLISDIYDLDCSKDPFVESAYVKKRIDQIKSIDVDADKYAEIKARACLAVRDTLATLEAAFAQKKEEEDQRAELKRFRAEKREQERKEREARIAKEAAEQAKREAEKQAKAEAERQQAEHERQLREAEEEAKARAEKERLEQERKIREAEEAKRQAELKAERAAEEARLRIEREAEEESRKKAEELRLENERKAQLEHRAKVHAVIKDAFVHAGFDEQVAERIVTLVKDGLTDYLTINY